jgi:hypothetical protein
MNINPNHGNSRKDKQMNATGIRYLTWNPQ